LEDEIGYIMASGLQKSLRQKIQETVFCANSYANVFKTGSQVEKINSWIIFLVFLTERFLLKGMFLLIFFITLFNIASSATPQIPL
jgi:hypothetical protein